MPLSDRKTLYLQRQAERTLAQTTDVPHDDGIFSLLPLGVRVIQRIERILREEMNAADGQEVYLPVTQPAPLVLPPTPPVPAPRPSTRWVAAWCTRSC